MTGKIVNIDGQLMVQHSPRKIYAQDTRIHKTFYKYDILDPFTDHELKEGDTVEFVFELYIANEGSFKFCEIVK